MPSKPFAAACSRKPAAQVEGDTAPAGAVVVGDTSGWAAVLCYSLPDAALHATLEVRVPSQGALGEGLVLNITRASNVCPSLEGV